MSPFSDTCDSFDLEMDKDFLCVETHLHIFNIILWVSLMSDYVSLLEHSDWTFWVHLDLLCLQVDPHDSQ